MEGEQEGGHNDNDAEDAAEEDADSTTTTTATGEGGECKPKSKQLCIRKLPDDIVAQLYLNSDFEGGAFYFEDAGGIRTEINPRCGKVIAFSSGTENMHGVGGVSKGKRCMLRVWLTKNPLKGKAVLPTLVPPPPTAPTPPDTADTADTDSAADRTEL
jgi:hypothetical protein